MTDFVIKLSDDVAAFMAMKTMGLVNSDLSVQIGGTTLNAEFSMQPIGSRMVPTGKTIKDPMGKDVPEMAPDGFYWVIYRWNGNLKEMPPIPPEAEVVWRSDNEEAGEYPSGLPRFA